MKNEQQTRIELIEKLLLQADRRGAEFSGRMDLVPKYK